MRQLYYNETFARLSCQGLFFRISQLFDLPFQKVPYFGHILDSLALLLTHFHFLGAICLSYGQASLNIVRHAHQFKSRTVTS